MKSLLAIIISLSTFFPAIAEENVPNTEEVILPVSPPQKVFQRYQTDFDYHHDRGFYLSASLGPQWNHSIEKPNAKGVRFGGKFNAGWFVADGFSLFASVWGNFLEAASIIAGGPGVAFLFDSTNIGIDFSVGIGKAFNAIKREDVNDFSESVLAAHLSIGKYWWLSGKTSMGVTLSSGIHGMSLSEGAINSFGWNAGFGLAFLFG
jgi:hypothetical protein